MAGEVIVMPNNVLINLSYINTNVEPLQSGKGDSCNSKVIVMPDSFLHILSICVVAGFLICDIVWEGLTVQAAFHYRLYIN